MALGYNAPGVPYNASYNYDGTGGVQNLTGSVAGTIVTSGTVAGREGATGAVTGTITTSGSVTGTGGNKQTSAYIEALVRQRRQRREPPRVPATYRVEHFSGRVAGLITINGSVLGQAELTLDDELALLLLGAL